MPFFLKIFLEVLLTFGLWVGGAQLGLWLSPDSNLCVFLALLGLVIGVKSMVNTINSR